jgi:prevent-host-death family protein
MKLAGQIKSVSHFKAHAPEVIADINETRNPVILTVNGEAKVIVQDMRSYEETQNTIALLQILTMGNKAVRKGRTLPVKKAFARIRKRLKSRQ